ncbi:hypothetical protein M407DRAFT_35422, partial [Tulasnella calospora MUT 4182]
KGGRKEADFVAKWFTREQKQDGKSERWLYSCNFCPQDLKQLIVHRDNALANHIIKNCALASAEAREDANMFIMKRGNITLADIPLTPATASTEDVDSGSEALGENPAKRKRLSLMEQRSIDSFLERPMTEEEKRASDIKFLRFLIHANVPFNVVNSPLLDEFVKSLRKTYAPPS